MKKIGKLALVAATAATSVLHAAGLKNATIDQKRSKLIIATGKGSLKQTILTIKTTDLKYLSSKSITAKLDPKAWTMSFSDSITGKLLFTKPISKKLLMKGIKDPIVMIASYSKKHLTLQLSKDSVPASAIMLTTDAKSTLADHFSMKLKNGKLSFAKLTIDLDSTIATLIGCTTTTCTVHSKHAAAIAANNPLYEKMLKKTAWSHIVLHSLILFDLRVFYFF